MSAWTHGLVCAVHLLLGVVLSVACGGQSQGRAGASGSGAMTSGGSGGSAGAAGAGDAGGSSAGGSSAAGSNAGGGGAACDSDLARCGDQCVDLEGSSVHCGSCDAACAAGETCVDGACECASPRRSCGGECTDLQSDTFNCGDCGRRCGTGTPCVRGQCGCPDGSVFCNGTCIDPDSDDDNCGGCGSVCGNGSACIEGVCRCPNETLLCGSSCLSVSGPEICGSCDTSCAEDELCAGASCIGEAQGCPAGTTRCGAACVNTDASPAHCGGCGQACAATEACQSGECSCLLGQQRCGDACVNTQTSSLDCGVCNNACAVGQVCQDGQCSCTDSEATRCGDACVYTDSDPAHCGACDNACQGFPCTSGECRCPEGEQLCESQCVNWESDARHCGACDQACPSGESCILGVCSGDSSDGCSNIPAHSISLTEIALYQAGKVGVMNQGSPIPAAERAADIVAGKGGTLRAFVQLEPGWQDRVVSARLAVVIGEQVEQLFHKKQVSTASLEASLATTFNFPLPPELLEADTSYSLEIVECATSEGQSYAPRFPAGGTQPLEAREVGPLKLTFVPIVANGNTAHTDEAHLEPLIQYMQRLYPVTHLEVSVGDPMTAVRPITTVGGWEQVLQQLSQRHQSDDAPNDEYYYGLLEPAPSMDEFCPNGCTVGIGYVTSLSSADRHYRVSMGLSYGDAYSAETMAHEVGHNHGREHAPCGGASDPDPDYPYAGASLGWWGFIEPDLLLAPTSSRDIMSYCENPWVSDYSYQGLLQRAAAINGSELRLVNQPRGHFRVIVVGPSGPVWGMAPSGEVDAAGTPEAAIILDRQGAPLVQVTVYRMRMDHLNAASLMVPEPEPGWHAIVVSGEPPLSYGSTVQSVP